MSEPTSGTPNIWKLRIPGMLQYMSSNVALLSPVQWAVCAPEPGNVDRERTKERIPGLKASRAEQVAMASVNPNICNYYYYYYVIKYTHRRDCVHYILALLHSALHS